MIETALTDEAWAAVAGATARTEIGLTGRDDALPSVLPTGAGATAGVVTALATAAELARLRTGRTPEVVVDRGHVADAVRSERVFRVDGEPAGATFAELSRFWPTADGDVRTHANYPWHGAALLRALALPEDSDVATVGAAMARRRAAEVEDAVFAEGGVTAQVRSAAEWTAHPQGAAVGAEPLVSLAVVGDASARERPASARPAEGVRVLDLTRVIAGPVCTRFLGALGADVLRLDPRDHDDVEPGSHADTLLGKRSAVLDLADDVGRLHELLGAADVLVCGYRPGALDRFGLTDDDLAHRHPGLVVVRLAAWGHTGPWRHRRGFDSVVQAGVGIADAERTADGGPGALPCQLLDHGTGYLAAAAVLDGVRRQATGGGTLVRRLSLARTAGWLLDAPRAEAPDTAAAPLTRRWTVRVGDVEAVAPPGTLDGRPLRWPDPPSRFLADEPTWAR